MAGKWAAGGRVDNVAHATRGGGQGQVDVIVDERTRVSKPLQKEHDNPASPIKIIRKNLNQSD